MGFQLSTGPQRAPHKRVRDVAVMRDYREIREGLLCEYCRRAPATELNHILHGSKKEDAFWNFVFVCHDCHQHGVHGFHGSSPEWDVERSLRLKLRQGFDLPRVAWAYLDGVDFWPGVDPDPAAARALAVEIAEKERRCRR